MITDEQGRKWILQKFHDQGFKYLYFNGYLNELCVSDAPPEVNSNGKLQASFNSKLEDFVSLEDIIEVDKPYIDIEKELGIVDWSSVAVDTPVIVWDNDSTIQNNRHFAKYEHGFVWTYAKGKTSWTTSDNDIIAWDNARLANVDKE